MQPGRPKRSCGVIRKGAGSFLPGVLALVLTASPLRALDELTPASPSPSVTPTRTPDGCVGNCRSVSEKEVTIDEIVYGVRMALAVAPWAPCPNFDGNADWRVSIDELVVGVRNAIYGCNVIPPTATATRSPTVTRTPASTGTPSATGTRTRTPTWTPVPTRTRTITGTPSATGTATATPSPTAVLCGGFSGSVPKICNVAVDPNPVRLFLPFRVDFCVVDQEGNLKEYCWAVRVPHQEPVFTCAPMLGSSGSVSKCTETPLLPNTYPAGDYQLLFNVRDWTGLTSNTALADFRIW